MFENEAKGSYGCYSQIGRTSVEKYNIIKQKDEILSELPKKIKFKDMFTPDDYQSPITQEEQIDVFRLYARDNQGNLRFFPRTQKAQPIIEEKVDKLKYHNKHLKEGNKRRKPTEPCCTRYNPNYDLVWPRTLIGPKWAILKGRNTKPLPFDEKDFYLQHNDILSGSKCFVNMKQQTQRCGFTGNNDIRIRNTKTFEPLQRTVTSQRYTELSENDSLDHYKNTNTNNTSYHNKSVITSSSPQLKQKRQQQQHNKALNAAPDFKSMISREERERVKGYKPFPVPLIKPNYSSVRERSLTMAIYDKPKNHQKRNLRPFQGIDPAMYFDPDKVIDKVNNHVNPVPPNFAAMTSRPNDNGPLPPWMLHMINRNVPYCITDHSLKMNNYKNGKMIAASTSFFPKKSFNRLVNLNLLKGEKYSNTKSVDMDENTLKQKELLQNNTKFYSSNFNDLIQGGSLGKFDNVTLKSIKREHRKNCADLEKYLIKFDNVQDNDDGDNGGDNCIKEMK